MTAYKPLGDILNIRHHRYIGPETNKPCFHLLGWTDGPQVATDLREARIVTLEIFNKKGGYSTYGTFKIPDDEITLAVVYRAMMEMYIHGKAARSAEIMEILQP